jgi:hypothetical protein
MKRDNTSGPTDATVASLVAILRRQGAAGLKASQAAARIGVTANTVSKNFRNHPDLFEATGGADWRAPYWRVRADAG